MNCELCELKTIEEIFDTTHKNFIIISCMSCKVPMAVWTKAHTMKISSKDFDEMYDTLVAVGRKFYKRRAFFIDTKQRKVYDHLHWHARKKTR
tara:strand:- start:2386 stop:2664 length:279 start_codon:yes stop_codon:yes gene_type:complete